jgi:hypothetical protein
MCGTGKGHKLLFASSLFPYSNVLPFQFEGFKEFPEWSSPFLYCAIIYLKYKSLYYD